MATRADLTLRPSPMRSGPDYWVSGYASMLRFDYTRMRQWLGVFVAVQLLMGAGMTVMYGFFLPVVPDVVALYITTGVPTLALIPIGFVFVPQSIAQQRLEGSYDYLWSLPVPKMVVAASTFTLLTLLALPGVVVALWAGVLRYGVTLDVQPTIVPALLARGRLGLVTLAPELPGAVEMIGRLAAAGLCVGIGHTMATPGVLAEAVAAGAKWSVHLGNGSHAILPRLDNYVQAQLADDRLAAGFIADGHHMPFTTLKNFIRAKTPTRSILVTDAVSAAELGPGRHNLGNRDVIVTSGGRVAYPGSVYLAGSVLTLDRAVLNVCWNCGVGFEDAWRMASTHPAALIGAKAGPE